MKEIKRKWDMLSESKRKSGIEEIITFFKKERDEEIGMIAAEEILDFFLQNIGEDIYKKGLEDSKEFLKKRFDDLELELELMINK